MARNFKSSVLAMTLFAGSVFGASAATAADVLKVGTEGTYAPFEFVDINNKGQLIGYDIDIMAAVAKDLGMELEVVNMPFDGLIPALMTQQIDAIAAAMSITEDRAKKVTFSDPYYKSGLSIIVRKDSQDKYKTADDLKDQTLCAQIGTTGFMTANKISGKVTAFNTQPEVFLELQSGGCEAVVNDRPVNLYYLVQNKDVAAVELKDILSAEEYGIAVRKGNTELQEKINASLKKLKESGEFGKIHKKWFNVEE
ncbi:basic amino acid ABC transporter substrate-binding protein [Anaerobiospirillum thomasii]|uniref:Glutamine-binding periplasmic protein n=1 Tax=Anaerobiospirillum thomasii TaxID=179995 RepID=A0A2X0WW60_9GAMM|nr:basic amino acid ABC transporter substrate-binding protein [Anaerobiospirillum thomasii]SPT70732.1 Glutamine-binding periplasmic protein precursor [Anaerobiospirillum thomasii]